MARLYYQGHGSYRITSESGTVIYIDPYAGDGYDLPADYILVTHQHYDHREVDLVPQKPTCKIITNVEALAEGVHQSFDFGEIKVEAVEACNIKHDPKECVGYILTVDNLQLYLAGDTSTTEQMKTFAKRGLDYALLPCDGIFNMGPEEATACAALINAKHTIPIHTKPGELFDREHAEQVQAKGRVIIEPGEAYQL